MLATRNFFLKSALPTDLTWQVCPPVKQGFFFFSWPNLIMPTVLFLFVSVLSDYTVLTIYLLMISVPVLMSFYLLWIGMEVFIPIMGRSGSEINPEIFIGAFAYFGVIVNTSFLVSGCVFIKVCSRPHNNRRHMAFGTFINDLGAL